MDKISFNKFNKFMTSQPFFVWNKLDDENHFLADDETKFKFNMPSFIDDLDEIGIPFTQVQTKSFNKIESQYVEWVKGKFNNVYRLKSKSFEDKAIETLKVIKEKKYDYIMDPVFSFEYKDNLIFAKPSIYGIKNHDIFFLKLSTSTKRKDLLKMWFDCKVLEHLKFALNNVYLHTLAIKQYKKGEIDFFQTEYINTSKGSRKDSDARKKYDFLSHQLAKVGMSNNTEGNRYETKTIAEIINANKLSTSKKRSFTFQSLTYYLDKIIDAKDITECTLPRKVDASIWSDNPDFNSLVELTLPKYHNYSGNVLSKKNIIARVPLADIKQSSKSFATLLNEKEPIIINRNQINTLIADLQKRVIWYDFEAFSLPFAPLDYYLPYDQVVSQVSVIQTDNEKTIANANLVFDPLNFTFDNFIKIIKAIYRPGHKYVVFNAGYENTRLNEMVNVLNEIKHPKALEAETMVNEIIENTIDLAIHFRMSKNDLPNIFIPELRGFHSIKKLEKYISNHLPNLPYKIKEYKSLDIKQGMMAMEKANNRALGIIGDNEWVTITEQLKEYCENDVKAMIMVFHMIKHLAQGLKK